jgi:hypothetical protein
MVREKFATKGMALVLWAVLILAIVADIVWLTRRSDGIRPWLAPQPVLSAAALILGFILLTWQLETQHRNTLEANRKQAQDRLKLDIFKEIAERIEATSVPLAELREVPTGFLGELVLRTRSRVASHYQSALQTVSKEASDSVVRLMSIMETYEIAMPEFKVFRKQLADSLRQAQRAFGDFAFLAFPLALPHTNPIVVENEDELSRLATITERATWDLTILIVDLRVAAQAYLLGGLFPDHRVPEQTLGDPPGRVTKLPRAEG